MIRNALTIDVEDYFQVSAFAQYIPRSSWDNLPCRVERNIDRILMLLDEHKIRATFFTLGWIAERYPAMVKRIVENDHELASHGYAHHRVTELSRKQFYDDITRSKALLEDIGSQSVWGYRAPSFSIRGDNLWALECLEEAGYRYSSSVYPVKHDHYGMPDAPRFAFNPENAPGLLELPVTTVRLFGRNFPAGGGRLFSPFSLCNFTLVSAKSEHD
ncbi:polysaccharide deacetylase family protein, PEP-CTERM locus subfamily [Nitrosomonas eutropha]|nr:polysaccharide deacetylase family protein, PEP-CTERM locus subfamily [Nitrosomonas eutropha]